MNDLEIRASGSRLASLAEQQTAVARAVGFEIQKFKSLYGHIPGWMKHLKDRCPELDDFSSTDISLFMRASEAYTQEEWEYKLPWCMYAYALRHTSDPASWIRKAVDEDWKFSDLREQVRAEKTEKSSGDSPYATVIYESAVVVDERTRVAFIQAFVDIDDPCAVPLAQVVVYHELLSPQMLAALKEAIVDCEEEVQNYLGITGMTVTQVTEDILTAA